MSDKINCQQVESWIQDALDDRSCPTLNPEILRHVHGCASCERQLNEFMWLSDALDAAYPAPLFKHEAAHNPGFAAEIASSDFPLDVTEPTSARRSRPVHLRWQTLIATMAASVLMIYLVEGRRQPMPVVGLEKTSVPVFEKTVADNDAPNGQLPKLDVNSLVLPSTFHVPHTTTASLYTVYEMTCELPGLRPLRGTLDATLHLFENRSQRSGAPRNGNRHQSEKRNLEDPKTEGGAPDVGRWSHDQLLCLC